MLTSWALHWALPSGYSCLPQHPIDGLGLKDCPLLAVEICQPWKPIPSLPSVQHTYLATPPVTYRYLKIGPLKSSSLSSHWTLLWQAPCCHHQQYCPTGQNPVLEANSYCLFCSQIHPLLSMPSATTLGWAFSPQITVLPLALVYCPFYWFPITAAMSLLKHRLDSVTPLLPFMIKPKLIYMP